LASLFAGSGLLDQYDRVISISYFLPSGVATTGTKPLLDNKVTKALKASLKHEKAVYFLDL